MTATLRRELRAFGAAARFLTCLPVPGGLATADDLAAALRYFPLVGLGLGAMAAMLDAALGALLARPLVDFLLLAALVVASGALHLDGLIDTADGLFGPGTAEERLARMRESWAGPRGAAAALAFLLVEYAALRGLDGPPRRTALVLAPLLGRWANMYSYTAFPYVRPGPGISRALKQGATPVAAVAVTLLTLAVALLLARPAGPLLLAVAWGIAELIGRLGRRRLGGMSGDLYGAVEQLAEAAVFVLAPLAMRLG